MKITCIADLHGYLPKLPGGDLLIVAGDLTARDEIEQYDEFYEWLDVQDYQKKVVIAGNHDNHIDADCIECLNRCYYLEDDPCTFEGFKIWGSPWTKKFKGINSKCCAFTLDTEFQMEEKFKAIPDDVDILITHSPPYAMFDINDRGHPCGSPSLTKRVNEIQDGLLLHVFGHIHERGGSMIESELGCIFVNASYVDERYRPRKKIIEVEL